MSFIDWSDPEEMMGLLIEYVADERAEVRHDPERRLFLSKLHRSLSDSLSDGIVSLRRVRSSLTEEFVDDPAVRHLDACIEELERIDGASTKVTD